MQFAPSLILAALLCASGPALTQAPSRALIQPATAVAAMAPSIVSAGQRLQLNGAGTREMGAQPLYTLGLYLRQPARSAEQVLDNTQPKQLRWVAQRAVSAREWQALMTQAVRSSLSEDDMASTIPVLFQLGSLLPSGRGLAAGDVVQVDWTADASTVISVNGRRFGEPIEGQARFNALARIWLGARPADAGLKQALLGQAA
ncbi:MAG: chalcone isomerase family protein [Burkholderiaceae bacterium]